MTARDEALRHLDRLDHLANYPTTDFDEAGRLEAELVIASHIDMPRLVALCRDILDRHKPFGEEVPYCYTCAGDDEWVPYPCVEVLDVYRALGVEP